MTQVSDTEAGRAPVLEHNPALIDAIAASLRLRKPNRDALEAIAEKLVDADPLRHLVADLATGVGKTYIAAGLIDYLAGVGVRNVVIVTPGSTIQRKTIANFTYGTAKYVPGMASAPVVLTVDSFADGSAATAIEDPNKMKVFVLTVQSLLRTTSTDGRRAHRPHESIGVALAEYLRTCEDLVVIADEHHTYSGNARQFARAIADMEPLAVVGLTATPDPSTNPADIVYHYPLSEAIADGFVKVPVLVARPDGLRELRTQLADGISLLEAKAEALNAYTARTGNAPVNPVLFVVCGSINEANSIRDILVGPDYLDGAEKVLLIHSDEPDTSLAALDDLENPNSPVRAVVSVSMLREGWDVKSIYVICSTRAMDSELLTEQVLGRGLRLPFGRRTGISMLDTVEVLSHRRFAELLQDAEALLTQTLGQRTGETTAITQGGDDEVPQDPTDLDALTGGTAVSQGGDETTVTITLPGVGAELADDPNQLSLFPDSPEDLDTEAGAEGQVRHEVGAFATIEARLRQATNTTTALTTTHRPRTDLGVRLPLFIPNVVVRLERDPFSLTQVDTTNIEALGASFANDNAPTLIRVAMEATRTERGVSIVPTDQTADARVVATQSVLPFNTVETDLVGRLMRSNGVAQTVGEHNAAAAIAAAFLRGAGVTEDTPWRAEHARLASEALVRFVDRQQTAAPVRQVADVSQAKWPEPEELTDGVPPTNRNLVRRAGQFVRNHPYVGWAKSFYPVVRFDSFSAEFKLGALLEGSPEVAAWTRVMPAMPLRIAYRTAAVSRYYVPDFIVIDTAGTHWVLEGKADSEMTDPVVIAKADAAAEWVRTVNASPVIQTRWAYALASETAIKSASGWSQLLAGSRISR
ncbi:DEAD/DEAH box helicase [Nocardioides sp.]|uniref:DEAD/DEAH box helicase n=1 Tax=Nocardioides sp. TaxID=35761 RepID=UPI002737252C|nr:DEAD/DEAH box helicase family protein [Nocardioides sp.]MDP3890498.1 DEAD/DEAH box helicase family protein [Nocardioides sp.]